MSDREEPIAEVTKPEDGAIGTQQPSLVHVSSALIHLGEEARVSCKLPRILADDALPSAAKVRPDESFGSLG